jgi:hypothetical protein
VSLKYVGRAPDSDASIVTKKYSDDRYSILRVDNAYIDSLVSAAVVPLTTQTYIDSQDLLRAKKTDVDIADAGYLALSTRGAANGVAGLDNNSYVPSANLPTLITQRKASMVTGTSLMSGDRVSASTITKDFQAATLTIADPGFPYIPLLFAQVMGGSVNGTAASPKLGTGSFGQMTILRASDDLKFSWGLATAHTNLGMHNAIPFADSSVNPTTRPPLTGASSFGLWLALFSGTTYTWKTTALNFFAIVLPGF